jgi:hypothetical protein
MEVERSTEKPKNSLSPPRGPLKNEFLSGCMRISLVLCDDFPSRFEVAIWVFLSHSIFFIGFFLFHSLTKDDVIIVLFLNRICATNGDSRSLRLYKKKQPKEKQNRSGMTKALIAIYTQAIRPHIR